MGFFQARALEWVAIAFSKTSWAPVYIHYHNYCKKKKTQKITYVGKDVEKLEPLCVADGSVK